MKTPLALIALIAITLTATAALAADVSLQWVNGDNPSATTSWKTIVFYSYSPGVSSTNYVGSFTNIWPTTTCVVTNLQSGRRYYFTVIHSDTQDLSDPSNEVNVKTKISNPKNLSATP